MRTPVVLLTGVDPDPMAAAMLGLAVDLPGAVSVRHRIDVERQVLERVVSDVTGVVDRHEIDLEHACVSCALREDVVPTLERVARDGRWSAVVAHLPVGAEAEQVCEVLSRDTRLARHLRVTGVVTALAGAGVVEDLLGDALLSERGAHTSYDDARGVGEVAGAMVEYADAVVLVGGPDPVGRDLVATLVRPGVPVLAGDERLDGDDVVAGIHRHERTRAWTDPALEVDLGAPVGLTWRADLRSARPFHPGRLLDDLESLGSGRHRSRGCFWLPTRPGRILVWDGAGGQLSIGDGGPWGRRPPRTRIVLTGVGPRPTLEPAYARMLATEAELAGPWDRVEDGFEPWLGPIREVA